MSHASRKAAETVEEATGVTVCISHAVRWVATKEPGHSNAEKSTLGDVCDASEPDFAKAIPKFLSMLRNSKLVAFGTLEVYDRRSPSFLEKPFLPNDEWDRYLKTFARQMSRKKDGTRRLSKPIEIAPFLWHHKIVGWESDILVYRGGQLQAKFDNCHVRLTDLHNAFDSRPKKTATRPKPTQLDDELNPKERDSLLRLLSGISTLKYGFDPDHERSQVTNRVVDDLARLGIDIHKKTVLKFLRLAAVEAPINRAVRDELKK